jgi:methylated-DNA-[protein]-cysteine S-methyltransferase
VRPVTTYAPLETPIGRLWLAASDAGLLAITHADGADSLFRDVARRGRGPMELAPDRLAEPMRQLTAFLAGERRAFDLALDLFGVPPFHAAVYRAAMEIPYGTTASYGELAAMAGSPRAARAAGHAMARCPLFPVVPCHRVIHADGSIGGWGPDPWIKRWLLALEGGARARSDS